MKPTLMLLSVLSLFAGVTTAQQLDYLQEDDLVLSIIQAEIDGEDYSELYYHKDAFLVFYRRDSIAYFANVWQKTGSQSYGKATLLEQDETENEMTAVIQWKYANTYDDETGTAIILLRLSLRPVAVAFQLSILTDSAELLVFKGYVSGSLNWKSYF